MIKLFSRLKLGFLIFTVSVFLMGLSGEAWARAGGGRSFGSRGSRGMSAPSRSSTSPYSYPRSGESNRAYYPPTSSPSSRGSLWTGLASGMAGGFLGSLLFRGLGGGGFGYGGGGGIGLLELLLLGGLVYFVLRFLKQRRLASANAASVPYEISSPSFVPERNASVSSPLLNKEQAVDFFFKIQAAFSSRNLKPVEHLLTAEMFSSLNGSIEELIRKGRVNRLENIAVRESEVVEEWQENGQDWSTLHLLANVIDYVVDEKSGEVLEGSRTEPTRFEEYWTFVRRTGSFGGDWKLSAIQQM